MYIDQCKDTVREESGYHPYRYKLMETMPNITGIHVSFGSETEFSVALASNVFLNWPQSRCFENRQYRSVDRCILLLGCLGRSVEYCGP
jgi:hypothetical protein